MESLILLGLHWGRWSTVDSSFWTWLQSFGKHWNPETLVQTNALLIDKVDSRYHKCLLEDGAKLSKKDLQALIAKLTKSGKTDAKVIELENAFMNNPVSIYEKSIAKLQSLSQSSLVVTDKKARQMFLDIYQRVNRLGEYAESKTAEDVKGKTSAKKR